jgi:hypothetical protein
MRYRRSLVRILVALAVALPLAGADLMHKLARPTPEWAWHERSPSWLLLCLVLLAGLLVLVRVPSILVPPAAGVLAGGVLGNVLSAVWNGLEVPNPIVVTGGDAIVAFNLADVWVLVGVIALFSVIGTWLVRNRGLLPEPRFRRPRGR